MELLTGMTLHDYLHQVWGRSGSSVLDWPTSAIATTPWPQSQPIPPSPPEQELLAAQVLEEHPIGVFRFLHDKIREAVYSRLSADCRRQLQHAAAVAIERCFADHADFG